MLIALLFVAVCFVAFTNGANANFKGVASLYGSGTTSKRTALLWGTATTFAGSLAAILVSLYVNQKLLKAFSGKDLVPDQFVASPTFVSAVALGTAFTSFLATRLGFPVSTTHALLGALVGAGLAAAPTEVSVSALGKNFLYPLLLSPIVAALLGAVSYWLLKCLHLAPDHRTRTLDVLHFLSTGAASFARGLNDTPKMAALLLVAPNVNITGGFLAVAVAIAIGALLDAERVAETLGKKITSMNPGQGFAASLVTAVLVTSASPLGLPLSTTHVSVGSLLGMGASTGQARWQKVGEILLAWFSTVPCGAIFATLSYWILLIFQ